MCCEELPPTASCSVRQLPELRDAHMPKTNNCRDAEQTDQRCANAEQTDPWTVFRGPLVQRALQMALFCSFRTPGPCRAVREWRGGTGAGGWGRGARSCQLECGNIALTNVTRR